MNDEWWPYHKIHFTAIWQLKRLKKQIEANLILIIQVLCLCSFLLFTSFHFQQFRDRKVEFLFFYPYYVLNFRMTEFFRCYWVHAVDISSSQNEKRWKCCCSKIWFLHQFKVTFSHFLVSYSLIVMFCIAEKDA